MKASEEKAPMKENLDEILSKSSVFKDSKSLVYPTKDLLDSNAYESSKDLLACETKEKNEFWKVQELDGSVYFEHLSRSNRVSSLNDDLEEGLSKLTTCKRNGNPFARDTEGRGCPGNIAGFTGYGIVDKENGARASNAPFTYVSELFGTDTHLYVDKGIVECKLPALKESNYNFMKDICMDEDVSVVDKIVSESRKDQPGSSVPLAADEDQIDSDLLSAGEPKASYIEDTNKVAVSYHTTKEDEDAKSLVPNGLKPSSEDNIDKHADKDSSLEDLMKLYGSKCTAKAKAASVSEKESSANTMRCLEESRVQNSKIYNSGVDKSAQQPDQMPSPVETINSQNAVLAADETNNDGPSSNSFDNSKSENGAIASDVNSTELALIRSVEKAVKNLPELSLKSEAISSQKDGSYDNLSASNRVHIANSRHNSVDEQSLESQDVANLGDKTSGSLLIGMHDHLVDGEASFSAAGTASGLITYSGPISRSGSISLRSESSTASARSFAFPLLQSEWNSSPVRMARAERRKHRGWRQSLLCCRF